MEFVRSYLSEVKEISQLLDEEKIVELADALSNLRENQGRLFILGVGGSAANASHMVNDVRKLCGIEAYSPADNVSELTARTNDDGWNTVFSSWLKINKVNKNDALFILSVGGGNEEHNVSVNLINAIKYAREKDAKVLGIVGRDGGYTKKEGDYVVHIPNISEKLVTPHAESFQAVVWHCLVSHPKLQVCKTKW